MRARIWWALVGLAIGCGIVLRWDAQYAGFVGDDAVQLAMLQGDFPAHRGFWDLFRFADNERDGLALMEFGYDAWWSAPKLRIAMFRPLSSALFALDHVLFGLNPLPFHVHSALWWVATVVAAACIFRETLTPLAAVVALFLFVLEEAHSAPVAWLANRSTLISCAFAFFGLWLHVRQRRKPIRRGRVVEAW
jgi:hypothetical protein